MKPLAAHLRLLSLSLCVAMLLFGCSGKPGNSDIPRTVAPPPAVTFTDVTQRVGIHFQHINGASGKKWMPETIGSGCAFVDYNGDGWLDILLVNGDYWPGQRPAAGPPAHMSLYRNNGDGTFTDVTQAAGLNVPLYGMGVAVGDYDNDGHEDLFITAVGGSRLFHNIPDGQGGRKFVDVTASCGIADTGWATSAAWLDYDRDGKLDLFVCHYVQWTPKTDLFYSVDGIHKSYARPQVYKGESCRLYHNLGGGRFEDVTERAGIASSHSKALGVAVSDYDGDGWPDILVANDTESNFLFHNQGDGTFKEIGSEEGIALSEQGTSRAGMGIDTADVLHNGVPDVLITNFSGEQLTLYRRDASGFFSDVAARSGVGIASQTYLGFGAVFLDYDLDGWPDLFITNGHIDDDIAARGAGVTYAEPCLLFRNLGGGKFTEVSAACGPALTTPRVGRGAAWGDFDNDGSPDLLLMTNGGAPALLHNENHTGNGMIRLILVGTQSNRDAFGARVRVTVGNETQTQEVKSGSSYLSASDHRLLFGLGTAAQADRIEIRWPSGKVQPLGPVQRMAAGQSLTIVEGK